TESGSFFRRNSVTTDSRERLGPMTHMRAARLLGIALAVSALAQSPSAVVACPNCKEAVSTSTSELGSLSLGFNLSVGFMLAVPFSILGAGAFAIRRAAKLGSLPEL